MANAFGNYNEPFINGSTLKRLYSKVVKDNIFQDIIARDGEACTEKYCEDTSVAQVTVLRVKPGNGDPRMIGGATNGGFFGGDAEINETVAYGVNLLDVFDKMHDIPEVQQDMMSVDLISQRAKIVGGQVARGINGCTFAAQLAKNFNDIAAGTITSNLVTLPASPDGADYLNAIIEASAHLDDGDVDNGVDTYPIEERAIFVRPSLYAKLMQKGAIIIGGSNYAQDMLKDGGVSHGDKADNVTGFCGRILDMPVYKVAKPTMAMVEAYLGLDAGDLDDVEGFVVSGTGTLRGLAFNATIKQIDSPNGVGIRMQPLYRWGAECILGTSVSAIVKNGFTNPATALAPLTVVAPGSRTASTPVTPPAGDDEGGVDEGAGE